MLKRKTRSSSYNNNNNNVRFMQPLIPDFLTSFAVPTSFMRHLEGNQLKTVALMTEPESRHWVVEVEDGRYFKNGWREFCVDHNLRVGDFLVFELQTATHLLFHVSVFDPSTACQRHYLPPSNNLDDTGSTNREPLKAAAEAAQLQLPAQSQLLSCQIIFTANSFKRKILYLPMHFARSNGLHNRKCAVTLVDGEDRQWEMRLSYPKSSGRSYITQGWEQLHVANCFKPGDIITLQLLKAGDKPTFKCYSSNRKSLRASTEGAQPQLPLSAGQSQSLSCQINFTASTFKKKFFYFPMHFARSNDLLKRKCDVTLVDGEERQWEMRLNCKKSNGQPYVVQGWDQLQVANCLKPGDILTLQLLKAGEKPLFKCYSSTRRMLPLEAGAEAVQLQLPLSPVQSQSLSCQIIFTSYSFKRNILYLPMHFARSSGLLNRKCDMILVDGEERQWEMRLSRKKDTGQPYILQGWKLFQVANCFKQGDIITLQLLKAGEKPLLKCYSLKKSREFSNFKSKPSKPVEAVTQVSSLQSQTPNCYTRLSRSCFGQNNTYIPRDFAISCGLANRYSDITLVDEKERPWKMRVCPRCNGQTVIAQGWKDFQAANCLKAGNKLCFQPLKAGECPILKCYKIEKKNSNE